jgi:hypothetical protein
MVLGGDLPPLRFPRCLGLLVLLDLLLLLVPGPILGPDLLVLWDRGQGVLDDPHPLRTIRSQGKGKKETKRRRKNSILTKEM